MTDPRPQHPSWPSAVYGPALLALLYMAPRIWSAHFGLLDDAVTLLKSRDVLAHPSISFYGYAPAGRFLPFYWLYWACWYALGGEHPAVYYLGNALLLAATVAALAAVMRRWGATPLETWVASLFFLFSAPVAECYFTLSKGEPVTLLAFLCALLAAHRAGRADRPAAYWALVAALALLAAGTKETAAASLGVVGVWYLLSFWRSFGKPVFLSRRTMAVYMAMLLAGGAPLLIGRILLRRSLAVSGSYASGYQFTWSNISLNILMWSYYLVREFPGLCLFLAIALVWIWRLRSGKTRPSPCVQPLLMMAAWMGCCGAIYLPWRYLSNYYLLPFSAAAAVFCGVMAGELRASFERRQARAVLGLAAALLAIAAINSANFARCQVMVDESNDGLVESLRRLPQESTVWMNVPFDHEYVYELKLHLNERLGRRDLNFRPLDYSPPGGRDYVVSMQDRNERWPPLRGPMLEAEVANWNRSWQGAFGRIPAAAEVGRTWQMADIGLDAAWCAAGDRLKPQMFAPMCHSSPRPTIDLRTASYGWRIDPYPQWKKEPVQAASFLDGVWTIGGRKLALGVAGDRPVAADWDGCGLLEPGIYRPSTNRWLIDRDMDGRPDLEFTVAGMQPGDVPLAGDWTGTHKATPGFYRPADGTWHVESLPVVYFGGGGGIPLAGDWDGDGRSTPGMYWPQNGVVLLLNGFRGDAPRVEYTMPAGSPVVVNWTGAGVDTVNTVKDGKWSRRFANCQCLTSNPVAEFSADIGPGQIFAGRWRP